MSDETTLAPPGGGAGAPGAGEPAAQRVVLVTGPSGAGRSTAIRALEDNGFEAIDNLPLSLLERLTAGPPMARPLALGIDARNRDFSVAAVLDGIESLARMPGLASEVLYLDCRPDVLVRRYSETRRRHPLAPEDSPSEGIARERDLLEAVRARADVLIDTSDLTPHELGSQISRSFAPGGRKRLAVSLESFSYKRGVPAGVDMVFDCRFLQNPYWVPALRPHDGREAEVAAFVSADSRYAAFFSQVRELVLLLLPAYVDEGKAHLSIAFGCTGGRHRSVALVERMAEVLADAGWQVSKRHRELERRATADPRT